MTPIIKIILVPILLLAFTAGAVFNNANNPQLPYDAGGDSVLLGAISYPTSLDTLTNPAATDSVATVSHSSQHSNVNDAVEALEAKLGVRSSTPVVNTILAGTATGESAWVTYATTSNLQTTTLTTTGLATLGSFISNASSTVNGNLTITGNSTSTNATTTDFAVSNITSAIPYANANGSFGELTVGSGLNLSGNTLSAAGATSNFSTTSVQGLATSTLDFSAIDSGVTIFRFFAHATSTNGNPVPCFFFNSYSGNAIFAKRGMEMAASGNTGISEGISDKICVRASIGSSADWNIYGEVHDIPGDWKYGTYTSVAGDGQTVETGAFDIRSTTAITSFSLSTGSLTTVFATSTLMRIQY